MIKLNILGINYNYSNFIRANLANWKKSQVDADSFVIVDDQSKLQGEDYELVRREFGNRFICTGHVKSFFNGINQLRAIKFGLEYIGVRDDEYYWVIDADDVPLENAVAIIKQTVDENPDMELIAFSRMENNGVGMDNITPIKSHPFWLKDAPTSSLVVKGKALRLVWKKLFEETCYPDVWYDIRISACVSNSKSMVSNCVSHIKIKHTGNDSARYKNDRFKTYKRIANSLAYYIMT